MGQTAANRNILTQGLGRHLLCEDPELSTTPDSPAQLDVVPQESHHGLCTETESRVSPEAPHTPGRSYAVTGCILACAKASLPCDPWELPWCSTESLRHPLMISSKTLNSRGAPRYLFSRQHLISIAQTRTQDLECARPHTNKPGPRATQSPFLKPNKPQYQTPPVSSRCGGHRCNPWHW